MLRSLLPVSFAVGLTLTFGTADAWAKGNDPVATEAAHGEARQPNTAETRQLVEALLPAGTPVSDDLIEYAQREARTRGLENFEGGSVIVIGASGLALVLLVVILVLLV